MAQLDGAYLWSLFTVQPHLEGRFFRYVAAVLANRLLVREKVRVELSFKRCLLFLSPCAFRFLMFFSPQSLTFEDRRPYLPSMDISKKYRKAKEGPLFYKSGAGWRKRWCEVSGGFLIVYHGSSYPGAASAKGSNSGGVSAPFLDPSKLSQQVGAGAGVSKLGGLSGLEPSEMSIAGSKSPREQSTITNVSYESEDARIRVIAALEGEISRT